MPLRSFAMFKLVMTRLIGRSCAGLQKRGVLGHCPCVNPLLVVLTGLGWSRHTCIPIGFMYYRDHFASIIVSLIESCLCLTCCHSLSLLHYKITQRKKSTSAVQIPEELTVRVRCHIRTI